MKNTGLHGKANSPEMVREQARPNIIIILADDMGFSDTGCYGSEIMTPNIDSMAGKGIRFTQMYNCARCCPSRASLLTGLYPHQAGLGCMTGRGRFRAYRGFLRDDCVTLAEILKGVGYRTFMSGKWHVGGAYNPMKPKTWNPGGEENPLPVQRGFDSHYGMLGGGGSYFHPPYMIRDSTLLEVPGEDYYITDALTDEALSMIDRAVGEKSPFFLYLAYTAPHWPLHALPEDIAKYEGKYIKKGWDGVRVERHEKLKGMNLLNPSWDISPRDEKAPAWKDVKKKEWEDLRMAVYAAQVDRMDAGIGEVLDKLRECGIEENTLIVFLSDNGGCAEFLAEDTEKPEPFRYNMPTPDGRRMHVGNTPKLKPGPDDTFMSYDLPWANASNTPFRLYKKWVHEGGISTPCVIQWPSVVKGGGIIHSPCHFIDLAATCIEAAGARYPAEFNGRDITPLEGESFMPLLREKRWSRTRPFFGEHMGNKVVRDGEWKLVLQHLRKWELYNMNDDRTELNDLSEKNRSKRDELAEQYRIWAEKCEVREWPPR